MRNIVQGIGAAAVAVLLASCSSAPEKTVFIEKDAKLAPDKRVPVRKVWKDPSAVMANYDKLIIADVRTDLRLDKSWMEHSGVDIIPGEEDKDLKALAVYMKNSFTKAITTGPCRMKVVKEKGPNTLILELAIVKVVANKPVLELGSTVGAAFLSPFSLLLIPVKSVAEHETKSPLSAYLAIEGKVRDATTGRELILFTLDEHQEGALLDLNKHISPYANVRELVDRWSKKMVEVINKRPLETNEAVKEDPRGFHDYTLMTF